MLLRPHKSQTTLTSTLFPRAVYCLYLRLIHQLRQTSSHHTLPTSEASAHLAPVVAWRPRCPALASARSLWVPGLSRCEPRAAPSVPSGEGTAGPLQPVLLLQ